ncbi:MULTISPECIES: KEOPS complex subunit Cgi121 [unclassified Haladaptatus]|uniref:KEOPS complex subunit Cgi121 n=1 Tax=unclassified Haladaptatus TaxID=2622732 RepID=UPI0023E7E8B6|nr:MULTISPECIES: KEOPS complex subunit Cgi121 [unclassified Haladaptatus]
MRVVEGTAEIEDITAFVSRLQEIGAETDCTIQAFDSRYVVSDAHLRRAVELADRAFERGENVADDRAVEILLYVAARRQINRALAIGANEGECDLVVLVDAERENGDEQAASAAVSDLLTEKKTLGHYDEERVCTFFDIGEAERGASNASLEALVLEQVALLDVSK